MVQIKCICFPLLHNIGGMPSGLQLEGNAVNFEILFVCAGVLLSQQSCSKIRQNHQVTSKPTMLQPNAKENPTRGRIS